MAGEHSKTEKNYDSLDGYGDHRPNKPKDFTVVLHRTNSEILDLGTDGSSTGDICVVTGELLSPTTELSVGSYIGRKITVATNLPDGGITEDVLVEYKMNNGDGTITTTALQDTPAASHFPNKLMALVIVGGTGLWAGAKGVEYKDVITGRPGYLSIHFDFN